MVGGSILSWILDFCISPSRIRWRSRLSESERLAISWGLIDEESMTGESLRKGFSFELEYSNVSG